MCLRHLHVVCVSRVFEDSCFCVCMRDGWSVHVTTGHTYGPHASVAAGSMRHFSPRMPYTPGGRGALAVLFRSPFDGQDLGLWDRMGLGLRAL